MPSTFDISALGPQAFAARERPRSSRLFNTSTRPPCLLFLSPASKLKTRKTLFPRRILRVTRGESSRQLRTSESHRRPPHHPTCSASLPSHPDPPILLLSLLFFFSLPVPNDHPEKPNLNTSTPATPPQSAPTNVSTGIRRIRTCARITFRLIGIARRDG